MDLGQLSNHLGNVLAVVSDRKLANVGAGISIDGIPIVDYYDADVTSHSEYYPFGMVSRSGTDGGNYRYGFQGQEMDDEIKGSGNSVNYKYRMHDPRIGRFFAVDPLTSKYPHYTPYSFSGNKVIAFIELEGLEEFPATYGGYYAMVKPIFDKLNSNAMDVSGGDASMLSDYSEAIGHAYQSLRYFVYEFESIDVALSYLVYSNNLNLSKTSLYTAQRALSAYSFTRYLEGRGGYDIYDINKLKGTYMFSEGYDDAMTRVKSEALKFMNNENYDSEPYTGAPQGSKAFFSDFGTSLGSFGLQGNLFMEKVVNEDNSISVVGTVNYTLVDTYRWEPGRATTYADIAGDHDDMEFIQDLGAGVFYIRSYFTVEFVLNSDGTFTYTSTGDLENATDLTNFIESLSNSYVMPEGTELINDHR